MNKFRYLGIWHEYCLINYVDKQSICRISAYLFPIRKGKYRMNRLIATGLAISAIALIGPKTADAASLSIDDASTEGSIIFNVGQFDTGIGFVLDGTTILPPSLGSCQRTVSEGTAGSPITHTFSGQFLTGGPLVPLTSATVAFTEAGGGISDILTFSYTGGGGSPGGPFGVATLTGTFVSDVEPGGSLAGSHRRDLGIRGHAFHFQQYQHHRLCHFGCGGSARTGLTRPAWISPYRFRCNTSPALSLIDDINGETASFGGLSQSFSAHNL